MLGIAPDEFYIEGQHCGDPSIGYPSAGGQVGSRDNRIFGSSAAHFLVVSMDFLWSSLKAEGEE